MLLELRQIVGACEHDLTISISASDVKDRIKLEMRGFALFRYQRAWEELNKVQDQDGIPPASE